MEKGSAGRAPMVRAMRMSSERTVAEMGVSSSGASLRRRQAHLATN